VLKVVATKSTRDWKGKKPYGPDDSGFAVVVELMSLTKNACARSEAAVRSSRRNASP
jgi:hypothetical protein